jgi:hypothetical protein
MYEDFDFDGDERCGCANWDPYYCTANAIGVDVEEETDNEWRDLEPCTCECHIGFEG